MFGDGLGRSDTGLWRIHVGLGTCRVVVPSMSRNWDATAREHASALNVSGTPRRSLHRRASAAAVVITASVSLVKQRTRSELRRRIRDTNEVWYQRDTIRIAHAERDPAEKYDTPGESSASTDPLASIKCIATYTRLET